MLSKLVDGSHFLLGYYYYTTHLKRFENWSLERRRAFELERLKETLMRASSNCRFYKAQFNGINFDPSGMNSLEDIRQIPVLRKNTVRACFSEIKSSRYSLFSKDSSTSGSTGQPLKYVKSFRNLAWEYAYHLRYFAAGGAGPGDRMAVIRSYVPKGGEPLFKVDPIFRSYGCPPTTWVKIISESISKQLERSKLNLFEATRALSTF